MSFLDRFLNAVRLNDDYDDDDEFLDEDEETPEEEAESEDPEDTRFDDNAGKKEEKPKNRFFRKMSDEEETPRRSQRTGSAQRASSGSSKVAPIRNQQEAVGNDMEVSVIKPTTMENTREIADTLMANSTVVLNLEGIDIDLAQRIIDFACGTCYAIHGSLQKVSSYIFILTPSTVEISGDIQDILNGGIPAIRSDF